MESKDSEAGENEKKVVSREIRVDPGQSPLRLDKFIQSRIESLSRSRIQARISDGSVLVNGKPSKANYKVRPNDEIILMREESDYDTESAVAEKIPLDIVYEDGHILVLNKEAGMVVHPGIGHHEGTLINALLYHLENTDLPVLPGNRKDRPGLVHRIDKDTSGLLVIAKTNKAMDGLARQFFDHSIERKYRAIVWGGFDEEKGTIDAALMRNPKNRLQQLAIDDLQATDYELEHSKNAITHYKVLEDLYYVSLVECQLETGRTHQIRAHFKHIGKPLFADRRYGGDKILKGTVFSKYKQFVNNNLEILKGQALHAYSLGFVHPESGEEMYFEKEPSEAFMKVLERWRNYVQHRKDLQ